MDKDRQAIIDHNRKIRLAKTGGDAGRLADVERSAVESLRVITARRDELKAENRLTDDAIRDEINALAASWRENARQLTDDVIDSILKRVAPTSDGMPERTANDREVAQWFSELRGDARNAKLTGALMGRDPKLAVALATDPTNKSKIIPQELEKLKSLAMSPSATQAHEHANEIIELAQQARNTLAEVGDKIGVLQ